MSQLTATVRSVGRTHEVRGREDIDFDLVHVDGVLDPRNADLAEVYRPYGRCLMVVDATVWSLYGEQAQAYFDHHGIALTAFPVHIAEKEKSLATVERIVGSFEEFGLVRKEPVLVVGGGLTTDVAGFACATYRRGTPYVRIPTTLIGLIDASVSIKVAVNHGRHKNRLGAYHASRKVFLDAGFLATLPEAQVRNGMAEIVKIAVVGNRAVFDLLVEHGERLLETRFGQAADADDDLRAVADVVTRSAIETMLALESPNLHELDLDRVIAFGHTWSPTLELAPETPIFHGHAISVDMALSTTLAERRGHVSAGERDQVLGLMSGLGLAVDSPYLTADLLERATASIIKTRDGLLRAAVPAPVGSCHFINDLDVAELEAVLLLHREVVAGLARGGDGLEMSPDAEAVALV